MRKILIVEDEIILREIYATILSTEPYIIYTASNGEDAIKLCTGQKMDLILLDMMMPKMDGLAFLEKCHELTMELPKIIILSNLSSGSELDQAISLGAHKSAVKADLSPKDLVTMVRYELQAV